MTFRGLIANTAGTALYGVIDSQLYSISPTNGRTVLGTLYTRRGTVGMKLGLNQLVITDGANGYVYDMLRSTFSRITADGWMGSYTVQALDGYFTFIQPNSQVFYISALEDATTLGALDFATANASPDKLVGQITTGRVLVLFGEVSAEIWQDSGAAAFPFERNSGAFLDVGLMAAHTAKELDNSVFWLGRDARGAGIVYKLEGYRAVRISTIAIEQVIQAAIYARVDVSQAVAYTYQEDGHAFYVLQVPGVQTTWVYDTATRLWHERAEFPDGIYAQHRGRFHAYCYGMHLIAGDSATIWQYDPQANTNAGDVLVRDRISPHDALPSLGRVHFHAFELDCTVGRGVHCQAQPRVLLRYSNDGGINLDSATWRTATLGAIGERFARARFLRCGSARDRVWQVRCTDDVPFAIVSAAIEATS